MNPELFFMENQWIIWLLLIWVLPWKGVALWRAARNGHRKWFITLLLVNTLSILEIVYLFYFSQKKKENHAIKSIPHE